MSFTLQYFKLCTTNPNWEAYFMDRTEASEASKPLYKILDIKNFGIYDNAVYTPGAKTTSCTSGTKVLHNTKDLLWACEQQAQPENQCIVWVGKPKGSKTETEVPTRLKLLKEDTDELFKISFEMFLFEVGDLSFRLMVGVLNVFGYIFLPSGSFGIN